MEISSEAIDEFKTILRRSMDERSFKELTEDDVNQFAEFILTLYLAGLKRSIK